MASGGFSQNVLERIRRDSDLVGLISQYISLKKSGQNYTGLCPFHEEKTPSFSVSPAKQVFHCFGCHAGGDTFSFIMKMEGQTFSQTVRYLADRMGIDLQEERKPLRDRVGDRPWLYRLQGEALQFFHRNLLHHPQAKTAREYLAGRGIQQDSIEAFHLGFALPSWNSLQTTLSHAGWTPGQLNEAGLVIPRNEDTSGSLGFYDRFRNRIIFPIPDLEGRILGFGGRTLDPDGKPKYLNSPETAVFSKGKLLYGLEKGREAILKTGFLIVVEGYFDVISAHHLGIRNIVATLGTALTEAHLRIIRRFTHKIKLIFDPDTAGIRAAIRSTEIIAPSGIEAHVIQLPEGKDPDAFLRQHGEKAFLDFVSGGTRLIDFAIQESLRDPQTETIEGKMKVTQQLLPMIQRIPHPIERGHTLKNLAEGLQVKESDLLDELKALRSPRKGTEPGLKPAPPMRLPAEEEIILHLLLQHHLSVEDLSKEVRPQDFSDHRTRHLISILFNSSETREVTRLQTILHQDDIGPELSSFLTALSLRDADYDDIPRTILDSLRTIKLKNLQTSMGNLQGQIRSAEREGRADLVRSLQGELMGLKKKSLEIGGREALRSST